MKIPGNILTVRMRQRDLFIIPPPPTLLEKTKKKVFNKPKISAYLIENLRLSLSLANWIVYFYISNSAYVGISSSLLSWRLTAN